MTNPLIFMERVERLELVTPTLARYSRNPAIIPRLCLLLSFLAVTVLGRRGALPLIASL